VGTGCHIGRIDDLPHGAVSNSTDIGMYRFVVTEIDHANSIRSIHRANPEQSPVSQLHDGECRSV